MSQLNQSVKNLFWLNCKGSGQGKTTGEHTQLIFVGRNGKVPASLIKAAPVSTKKSIKAKSTMEFWQSSKGPVWLIQAKFIEGKNHYGLFNPSAYSMARDLSGSCLRQILGRSVKSLSVQYIGESEEEFKGLCVGLELAQYRFKNVWPKDKKTALPLKIKTSLKNDKALVSEAGRLGESVNLARFLVDLPPNILTPKSYAELLKSHFSKKAKTKVSLWNEQRLKKEKMGLHLCVGQGSQDKSYMVHVEYRGGGKQKPVAFVGKGITFDSGGLDIKPGSGMRLMKKDMGGSASVAGLAHYVISGKLKINCDFYFAIAENAINEKSFRPSDIITSRQGTTVEIHNTDAEGRLVMADVLTVAVEKKPQFVIDIATLTGAIKYGLGAATPGLFSNDDNLAETLLRSGQARGDVFWRMPLVPEEKSRLKSDVADLVNCTDGYGGAITAALFLENFVAETRWAHFDIYAWTSSAKGPLAASGGTGQVVQALSHFLENQVDNHQ